MEYEEPGTPLVFAACTCGARHSHNSGFPTQIANRFVLRLGVGFRLVLRLQGVGFVLFCGLGVGWGWSRCVCQVFRVVIARGHSLEMYQVFRALCGFCF